jgi:hypothetical protein
VHSISPTSRQLPFAPKSITAQAADGGQRITIEKPPKQAVLITPVPVAIE